MNIYQNKIIQIFLNIAPIFIMIAAISFIENDYILCLLYILVIIISLVKKHEKNDYLFLLFGLIGMFFSEWIFISTGVEKFQRISLFGIMPIWLPFLWAYAFLVIRRIINIIEK